MSFRAACNFTLVIASVSPTCALNTVTLQHRRVVTALRTRNICSLRQRLALPLFYRHVTIVSSSDTTNCNSFYRRLVGGSCRLRFSVALFPTVVRNSRIAPDVVTRLSDVGTGVSGCSYIIVVHNKNTATSVGDFSSLPLTRGVTGFPLPIVANVNRSESRYILSLVTCRQTGAPATITAFLISRLLTVTTEVRRTRTAVAGAVPLMLSTRGGRLRRLTVTVDSRTALCTTEDGGALRLLALQLGATTRSVVGDHRRRLSLLTRHVSDLSPGRRLLHNCSLALRGKRIIHSPGSIRPKRRVAAVLTRKAVRSMMRWPRRVRPVACRRTLTRVRTVTRRLRTKRYSVSGLPTAVRQTGALLALYEGGLRRTGRRLAAVLARTWLRPHR